MSNENDKPDENAVTGEGEAAQEDRTLVDTQAAPPFAVVETDDDGTTRVIGLGYKQDPEDPRDYPAEQLLGAPVAATPEQASVREWRHGYLAQGVVGSCVAHALARGIDINIRFNLAKNGYTDVEPPKPSRRFMYFNARQAENVDLKNAGRPVRAVEDVGSYPRLAMRAVQKLGFPAESFFEYSDAPTAINQAPPPNAFKHAFDQKDFRYYRIASVGMQRIADVSRALKRGSGVIFGMFVDSEFMRNKGQRITGINLNDPNGGGHMMTVLAVEQNSDGTWDVIIDNWWTDQWGNRGIGRIAAELFGSAIITDVYVIEAAPYYTTGAA